MDDILILQQEVDRLTDLLSRYESEAESWKALYEKEKEHATTDALTGLPNRRALDEFGSHLVALLSRKKGKRKTKSLDSLGAIMIDIDHFKKFNDTYGHLEADKVLAKVAEVLRKGIRQGDQIARYGGEEFAILLPGISELGLKYLTERLRKAVAETVFESVPSVTISVGCVRATKSTALIPLLKRADKALYKAKNAGRNQVVIG